MSALGAAPRTPGSHRALGPMLRLGALYDLVFAALMVAAPAVLSRGFALPLPAEAFYLRLIAVFLGILAASYWIAARDPERFRPFVWVAVLGRAAGFAALALSALGRPELRGLWGAAAGDLFFAVGTLLAGRRLLLG